MNAPKATELRQESQAQNTNLDTRYGKIGISAVAAAMCHKAGEPRPSNKNRFLPLDSD